MVILMPDLRNRHFFLTDLVLLPAAVVVAFALRFDAMDMPRHTRSMLLFMALAVPIKLIVFRLFGLYRRYWRYASVDELMLIVLVTGVSSLLIAALLFGLAVRLAGIIWFPRSIPFIDALLTLLVVGGPRFAARLAGPRLQRQQRWRQRGPEKPVLIMGAGDAGAMIVREMQANPQLGLVAVGFLDDDPSKWGVQIHGVPVLGGRQHIPEYDVAEVIIAMPTASGSVIREIVAICSRAGVPARTIPGLYDILSGQVSINQIRQVDIEDLLRRDAVRTDITAVERMLCGRRVLVTGAGGSIGAELCRQIARCEPAVLVLVGHGENSVFSVFNQLKRLWPGLPLYRVIADVRDADRMRQVFQIHQPQIVFHAAAHKHVPLMELNAPEAVTNNVQGTACLLKLSEAYDVERFVFISTDKAVNPVSVMGATKRVAELLVQQSARRTGRPFVAVRFGNVLDSRGSVVPLFREQIAQGGPVTVTHPEIRRYFMTIAEAVQLVLQSAVLGRGGEVFLLDMGEPIRIADLAKDMIELSGFQVGRDIDIVYTGLRPGEKLVEHLYVVGEEVVPTRHEKIFISHNSHVLVSSADLDRAVEELLVLARRGDESALRAKLREIVPQYVPAEATSATETSPASLRKAVAGPGRDVMAVRVTEMKGQE